MISTFVHNYMACRDIFYATEQFQSIHVLHYEKTIVAHTWILVQGPVDLVCRTNPRAQFTRYASPARRLRDTPGIKQPLPRREYWNRMHDSVPPLLLTMRRQWAVRFLGLNINRAYARRLSTCRNRLSCPSTTTIPNPGYGSIFRYPTVRVFIPACL